MGKAKVRWLGSACPGGEGQLDKACWLFRDLTTATPGGGAKECPRLDERLSTHSGMVVSILPYAPLYRVSVRV